MTTLLRTSPMLNETFKEHLSEYLDSPITQTSALTGGDINDVYKLDTGNSSYVVKTNDANAYPDMFKLEKLGLDELAKTKTFRTPRPLHTGNFENKSEIIRQVYRTKPLATNREIQKTKGVEQQELTGHV